MKAPINEIHQLYASKYGDGWRNWFNGELNWHMQYGYVLSSPEYFTMGFPVSLAYVELCIKNGHAITFDHHRQGEANCWFVWASAGDLIKSLDFIPHKLPFVAFARRGRLRIHRFDQLTRRIGSRKSLAQIKSG